MSERAQRVEAVFLAALEQPAERIGAFVQEQCADDESIADEVRSLLKMHGGDDGFMDSKDAPGRLLLSGIGILPLPDDEPTLPTDRRVGPYSVVGILGAGGMGVVYVAEQDRPHRTVALKVLRKGIGSSRILRRFEYEAEVLGRLHHPGIAQVFEAGTYREAGSDVVRPYIAMELVRGKNLIEHARSLNLGTRARLELIARVCDAMQHAHHAGVIHRDLKPANILVAPAEESAVEQSGASEFAAVGQPKVLDFGVARAADAQSIFTTVQTGMGQIIGTLPYMSPEQISGPADLIDARTDVYAIGAILYQLLSGKVPHDLRSRPLPEVARVVSNDPIQRLSVVDKFFRGDIETIVGKALEKDRARRYQSPAELAADIRRYLAGLPIVARQDSAMYVLRTQLRRYRHFVAGAAIFLVTLTSLAIIAVIQASRATRAAEAESIARVIAQEAERTAVEQRNRADATADELTRQLRRSDIERGRALGAGGSIRSAEDLLWREYYRGPDSMQGYWALWELYQRQPVLATAEISDDATYVDCLPDGSAVVVSSSDGFVHLRDSRTLRPIRSRRCFPDAALSVACTPDGRLLAVSGRGREVLLLDPVTLQELCRFDAGPGPIRQVVCSPDGSLLATTNNDGTIGVFDAHSLRPVRTLGKRGSPAVRLAISPRGAIAAAISNGELLMWTPGADAQSPVRINAHEGGVGVLAFNPDGSHLVSAGTDRLIRCWDPDDLSPRGVLESPNGWVRSLRFTPDGTRLISAGWWNVEVWDFPSRSRLRTFPMPQGVAAGVLLPRGDAYVTASARYLRAYDMDPDPGVRRLPAGSLEGRATVAFSPSGRVLAAGDSAGAVTLWDPETLTLTRRLMGHTARVRTIEFHPTRPLVAAASEDHTLIVWNLDDGSVVYRWTAIGDVSNRSLQFSPDGRWIAMCCDDRVVRVRSVEDGQVALVIPAATGELIAVRFSPDGRQLAVTNRLNKLAVWNVEALGAWRPGDAPATATLMWRPGNLPGEQPWTALFSADGKTLVTGDWSRNITIWGFDSSQPLGTLEGHSGLIVDLVPSPRSADIIASSSADGTIRLWNLPDRQNLATIELFKGWDALTLAFEPGGRVLAAASATGQVALLDLDHFQRHMAGNMAFQADRLARLNCVGAYNDLRNWADRVLSGERMPIPSGTAITPAPSTPPADARPRQ